MDGPAPAGIGNRKLALIHAIKRELGLSDGEYRDILQRTAGVRSARDLSPAGFQRLMRYLVRSAHYVVAPGGLTIRQKMFILHLRRDLGWTDEHLGNFLAKYYGVSRVEALSRGQALRAIESLKHIVQRRHGLHTAGGAHGQPPAAPGRWEPGAPGL